ncbi:stage II sporulation protein M [Priestia taiwanensis]|uniref:Stage II sporulation protein M n=1 Tax=Priestia taiwanensis TaxID=1347902 RepID=A0A917AJS1_9BACI|nr:stage II sporulation protein M [Priestia taiwanensis]MBM7361462.1 stage II sporulation protein M [Priestia taiwanensis]GGE54329.1 stage II sporulation protein M [Priestia taiwanensis]
MGRRIGLKDRITLHIREHSSIYLFVSVLLLMGVVFGAIIVNSIHLNQKKELFSYLEQFFGQVSQGKLGDPMEIFKQSYFSHLKYIALIWLLGISVIGLPVILILVFTKGIVVGFTVGFLVDQLGWEGFMLSFVSVLPQNLLIIPLYIIVSTLAVSCSMKLIRQHFINRKSVSFLPFLMRYTAVFTLVGVFLLCASLFEAFASPYFMKGVFDIIKE